MSLIRGSSSILAPAFPLFLSLLPDHMGDFDNSKGYNRKWNADHNSQPPGDAFALLVVRYHNI